MEVEDEIKEVEEQSPLISKRKGEDEALGLKIWEKRPMAKESWDPLPLAVITPPNNQNVSPTKIIPINTPIWPAETTKKTSPFQPKVPIPHPTIQKQTPDKSKTPSPSWDVQNTNTSSDLAINAKPNLKHPLTNQAGQPFQDHF